MHHSGVADEEAALLPAAAGARRSARVRSVAGSDDPRRRERRSIATTPRGALRLSPLQELRSLEILAKAEQREEYTTAGEELVFQSYSFSAALRRWTRRRLGEVEEATTTTGEE